MNDQHPDAHAHEPHPAIVERLLDLAVYAPVGVAVTLRDELPKHIKQGRQAIENRIQLARFIGQLAVQTGQRELQKRIEQQRAERRAAEDATDRADAERPEADAGAAVVSEPGIPVETPGASLDAAVGPATADPADAEAAEVPSVASLPISDYESLPAINVVERLRSMSTDEIEAVRRFEVAHRARRTILAKIDQLQERQADA